LGIFTVDSDKCKRDGICVAECPMSIIEMKGKDEFPSPVDGAQALCINCGHCVAVCPHGAISLATMKAEECLPVRNDLLPGPDQVEHFLQARRSIRCYKNQAVDWADLAKLIDIARYSPSGHNAQPVHWLVIEDKDEVQRLSGLVVDWMRYVMKNNQGLAHSLHLDLVVSSWENGEDRVCRNAPHVILAHAAKTHFASQSACTIALTYLELAASSMGLGACWAGYFGAAAAVFPPLIQALNVPEGHQVFGAMMIGYPRYQYQRIPMRNKPVVTWR